MPGNKKQTIGILGFGEVGQAIAKFYKNPKVKDLTRDDGLKGVDILNICVPWNDEFVNVVETEARKIKPKLIIIHSTIAPGTTKFLQQKLRDLGTAVVHSPIRGVHPFLYKGIKTFVKYIGADSKEAGKAAEKHLKSLKIKTKVFIPSMTTEVGKLLDTTYYGLCIAFHGEMKNICDKFNINFEEAVTDFNKTYNEGYMKLGKKNVIRPVLYPPEQKIGGHCILPNAKILKQYFPSDFLEFILKYDK